MSMNDPLSLYIHIPFCVSRCSYCDFTTFAGKKELIPEYIEALKLEIEINSDLLCLQNPVHSIYFGGGTPSMIETQFLSSILETIRKSFQVEEDAEITLEMNPGDANADYLRDLKLLGINRISLGMQSNNPDELEIMGRRHSPQRTIEAVNMLRKSGLQNFSVDLIYGFPTQTMQSWQDSIQSAIALNPAHISLYALSIEEGTLLQKRIFEGKLQPVDEDISADMYDFAEELLEKNGYIHYEIANWAKNPNLQSRHNMQYWLTLPYLGFGTGAHGNIDHVRTVNMSTIDDYIESMKLARKNRLVFPASKEIIPQTEMMEMQDFVMLRFRLIQTGVDPAIFKQRFEIELEDIFHHEIESLLQKKLIEVASDGRLLLRKESILVANQVFMEFVSV